MNPFPAVIFALFVVLPTINGFSARVARMKHGDDNSDECVSACVGPLDTVLKAGSKNQMSSKDFKNPMFDKRVLMMNASMSVICEPESYKNTTKCINDCLGKDDANIQLINVLKFVCETNIKDITSNSKCFDEGETISTTCTTSCGVQAGVLDMAKSTTAGSPSPAEAMKMMGTVCNMFNCLYPCEKDGYKKLCDSDKPATLMNDLSMMIMNYTIDKYSAMSADSLLPKDCKVYTGMEAAGKPDTALSIDGGDMMTQKLQLEMKVLDKQSTVLDLQLEELKAEKAYYDKMMKGNAD